MKILLELEEVNPDKRDNGGKTRLSYSTWFGHAWVVKKLLGWEQANLNNADKYGQTSLMLATMYGHKRAAGAAEA